MNKPPSFELGFFGNIWVRENRLNKIGDFTQGHYHRFDHVTMLVNGSVEVSVDGYPPKQFHAPIFIVIKKEHSHKFKALTPGVIWYCVFALRDVDGDITDIYSGDNSPYGAVPADYWEKQRALEQTTTITVEKEKNHGR